MLVEYDFMYGLQLPPECCAVRPENRGGQGRIPIEVHVLLGLLITGGWSWDGVRNAFASEIPPRASDLARKQLDFNVNVCAQSDGLLPMRNVDMIRVFTLACSHTTAGLRSVKARAKAVDPPCREA